MNEPNVKSNSTAIDLLGQRFERWVVVSFYIHSKPKIRMWNCLCDCGKSGVVSTGNLRSGGSKSCGCLKNEITSARRSTHGMSKSREYSSYVSMLQRCTNKSHPDYADHYGGQGVKICDRWLESFENFYADMGAKPEPKIKYSIERKDPTGNYEPSNCYWIHKSLQPCNSSKNTMITWDGETMCLGQWGKKIGIDYHTLSSRYHKFKMRPPELFKPVKKVGNGAAHRKGLFTYKTNAERSRERRDKLRNTIHAKNGDINETAVH